MNRKRAEELLDGSHPLPGPAATTGTDDEAVLARLLAAVTGPPAGDSDRAQERQEEALAAFREARDAPVSSGPARAQDDWRPRQLLAKARGVRAPGARSARLALGTLAAGAALCGVAVAAGSGVLDGMGPSLPGGVDLPTTPTGIVTSAPSGTHSGAAPDGTGGPTPEEDRPAGVSAKVEALCRAYERAERSGDAPQHESLVQLAHAAGEDETVAEYCERVSRAASSENAVKLDEAKKNRDKGEKAQTKSTGKGQGKGQGKGGPGHTPGPPGSGTSPTPGGPATEGSPAPESPAPGTSSPEPDDPASDDGASAGTDAGGAESGSGSESPSPDSAQPGGADSSGSGGTSDPSPGGDAPEDGTEPSDAPEQ